MKDKTIKLQDYSRDGFEPTHYAINGAYKFAFSHLEDLEAHKENWLPMFDQDEKMETGLLKDLERRLMKEEEENYELVSWQINR